MKPNGRPPLDRGDKSVPVCVKIPSRVYHEAYQHAKAARVSVPEIFRRALDLAHTRKPR